MYGRSHRLFDLGPVSRAVASGGKYSHYVKGVDVLSGEYHSPDYTLYTTCVALAYPRIENFRKKKGFRDSGIELLQRIDSIGVRLARHPEDFNLQLPNIYGLGVYNVLESDFLEAEQEQAQANESENSGRNAIDDYFRRAFRIRYGVSVTRMPDVELFLKQETGSTAYVLSLDNADRTLVIFRKAPGYNAAMTAHAVASCLPRLLPWLFEDMPLSEHEGNLLRALLDNTPYAYYSLLEEAFVKEGAGMGIHARHLRCIFEGYYERQYEKERDQLKDRINSTSSRLESCKEQLRTYSRSLEESRIVLAKLEKESVKGFAKRDETLSDYFTLNKSIELRGVRNGTLEFDVCVPLKNFDPDIFDSYKDNAGSILYDLDYSLVGLSDDQAIKLLSALFETEEVEILLNGSFSFTPSERWNFMGTSSLLDGIGNPHLVHFDCFGEYGSFLEDAVSKKDAIEFIETCIASVGSLNIGEAITFEHFLKDLFFEDGITGDEDDYEDICLNSKKCIRFPDGSICNVEEAICRLEEKGSAENLGHDPEDIETEETDSADETAEAVEGVEEALESLLDAWEQVASSA